jgi:hypothetical protein
MKKVSNWFRQGNVTLKGVLLFFVISAISGFLSFLSFKNYNYAGEADLSLIYGPGWIFGIAISSLLYFLFRKNSLFYFIFIFLFVAISTLAFYFAILVLFGVGSENKFSSNLAGLTGALTLALGIRLLYPIKIKHIVLVSLIGMLMTFSFGFELLGLLIVWQISVGLAIFYVVKKSLGTRVLKE